MWPGQGAHESRHHFLIFSEALNIQDSWRRNEKTEDGRILYQNH
jgi:hypothetical protein